MMPFTEHVIVIAQRHTARLMADFEGQRTRMLATVRNDSSVFAHATARMPDLEFDRYLRIDLGDRFVELYHFGQANSLGNTVVYEPTTRTAWTGNLILGEGSLPFLLAGAPSRYLETLTRMEKLTVDTIIPGHGAPATAAIVGRYLDYLHTLGTSNPKSTANGMARGRTVEASGTARAFRYSGGGPRGVVLPWPPRLQSSDRAPESTGKSVRLSFERKQPTTIGTVILRSTPLHAPQSRARLRARGLGLVALEQSAVCSQNHYDAFDQPPRRPI